MLDKSRLDGETNKPACDANLSRKEFLTKLVQRAAVAGSLIAAPQIVDKFLVPPAYALNSTTTVHDTNHVHDQTQHFHDSHAPFRQPGNFNGGGSPGKTSPSNPPGATNSKHDLHDTGVDDWG